MTKRLAELKKRIEQAGGREKVFRMFDAEAAPLRTAGIEVETILKEHGWRRASVDKQAMLKRVIKKVRFVHSKLSPTEAYIEARLAMAAEGLEL
jgi:hypothetical protein